MSTTQTQTAPISKATPSARPRFSFTGSVKTARVVPLEPAETTPTPAEQSPSEQGWLVAQHVQQLAQNITAAAQQLDQTLQVQSTQRQQFAAEFQRAAVELACYIAERVVRQSIDAGSFNIEQRVQELTQSLNDADGEIRILLHPQDLKLLEESGNEIPEFERVKFSAGSDIQPGSCRAESSSATLLSDCAIELRELRRGLLEAIQ